MPPPVVYVSNSQSGQLNSADLLDLAFLLRSPSHELRGICTNAEASFTSLAEFASPDSRSITLIEENTESLAIFLRDQEMPVSLVVVSQYSLVAQLIADSKATVRAKVARIFLIGGHINEYGSPEIIRLPIDPPTARPKPGEVYDIRGYSDKE